MSLFIKQIADKLAGQVAFSLPDNGNFVEVVGFLSEDPVIKMGNKWDSLIPDLGSINDFMQIANQGQSSWISTSKMAWKGTDPITVMLNFYLITYLKSQVDGQTVNHIMPVSKQAECFAKLAAISQDDQAEGFFKDIRINVHGGYKPNYFESNDNVLNNTGFGVSSKDRGNYITSDDGTGTCHIVINGNGMNSVVLRNMLLESLDMTPSTVRAGYWNDIVNKGINQTASFKGSGEPLYIKVAAGFKLARAATINDVKGLFGGSYGG